MLRAVAASIKRQRQLPRFRDYARNDNLRNSQRAQSLIWHKNTILMNTKYQKPLPGTKLHYFDAQAAVDALQAGAWARLPYTARVHAENIVRKADPAIVDDCLLQIIGRKRERDFPWYPARVVCHDILGQTALVDLAGGSARRHCPRGRRPGANQPRGARAAHR